MTFLDPSDEAAAVAVRAWAATHPSTQDCHPDPLFVTARGVDPRRQVALVSGGGAGHEPLHAGFVGPGGLDAAVPGRVFASPHSRQVYRAARAVARPGGVLLVVKNYTGDVVNFGIAAERLRADGISTELVLVADDVATSGAGDGDGDTAGEGPTGRGTAATVVVEQLLAAAADQGAGLAELAELGRKVAAASQTLAVADQAHHTPGEGTPAFELDGGLELGVGIHGERAAQTVPAVHVDELVEQMVQQLLAARPERREPLAVLVNDLGGLSGLELATVAGGAAGALAARGCEVALVSQGRFTTALDMRGFSLTLTALRPDWLATLAAASPTLPLPRWDRWSPVSPPAAGQPAPAVAPLTTPAVERELAVLQRLVATAEPLLTRLDQQAGDGDFGDNLSHAVAQGLRRREHGTEDEVQALTEAFLDDVGGSSGPLFGVVLQHVGRHRGDPAGGRGQDGAGNGADAELAGLATGLRDGVAALTRLGGARPGDRTMVDALAPAATALAAVPTVAGLAPALEAAIAGARETATMSARRGRARYVGERAVGSPDPGAVGAVLVLAALFSPQWDGAEAAALALVQELAEQG